LLKGFPTRKARISPIK